MDLGNASPAFVRRSSLAQLNRRVRVKEILDGVCRDVTKQNIRLDFAYDGTDFHGFQRQPGLRTVQGTLEEAIGKLSGEDVSLLGAGRTDAGVHAKAQVGNFATSSRIPLERWPLALNSRLPHDLVVIKAAQVPAQFHARRSALAKTYRYTLQVAPYPDVFWSRFAWHIAQPLDIHAMRAGAAHLVGTWDFTSFCSAKTEIENKVRTLFSFHIWQEEERITLEVEGNGFLYNMVRIMVGTLVEVGLGKRGANEVREMLSVRRRTAAGMTAPPQGLVLWRIKYPALDDGQML